MDEHGQGVMTNGARAESRSEQGWGKDLLAAAKAGLETLSFVCEEVGAKKSPDCDALRAAIAKAEGNQ